MSGKSGKKGKKSKGAVLSLQTFLSNGDAPAGTTQVSKNLRNIDGDDSDDGDTFTVVCQLPTAPRANRILDENNVPFKAPFVAYVTNLPFDINDEDIYDFFNNNHVVSVRLPREDGDTGRVRGFGYVEFETRNDLIDALGLPDPSIKGRRVRIELSNESDQSSRRGNRKGFDTSGNSENRDSTDWRRDNLNQRREYDGGSERKSGYSDDRSGGGGGGSWRTTRNRAYDSDTRNNERNDRPIERRPAAADSQMERPKLNLKPRTLPIPEREVPLIKDEPSDDEKETVAPIKNPGVSAEKVFGSARPVDTTARDLEVEQRMEEVRRQENLKKEIESSAKALDDVNIENQADAEKPVENNWRKMNNNDDGSKRNIRSEGRRDNRDNRDYDRRNQEKSERYNSSNERSRDVKQKDAPKPAKRDQKERPLPQYTEKQDDTSSASVSSNKYAGLDDESE